MTHADHKVILPPSDTQRKSPARKRTMTTLQTIKTIENDYKMSHNITGDDKNCKFEALVSGAWRTVWVTPTTVTVGGLGLIAGTVVDALRSLFRSECEALNC